MIDQNIDKFARTIWDFHRLNQKFKKSDAIFALCSIDSRVGERAAELYLQGYGDYVIFSGGIAHNDDLLATSWEGSEAEHFADIAIKKGVPKEKIIIENKAQNTGENIIFTRQLLSKLNLNPKSFILVQKPYMERRTYATFKKQWPDISTQFYVTSPEASYDMYFNDDNPKERIINIMVGDMQRIKEYPALGYQIEQNIPDDVWTAYKYLVKAGFTKHLMK